MSEGHFVVRAPVRSVDEIGALGRALNVMVARLREKIDDLEQERAKVNAILDGMVEGVIAVDGHESHRPHERARARDVRRRAPAAARASRSSRSSATPSCTRSSARAAPPAPTARCVRELRLRHPVAAHLAGERGAAAPGRRSEPGRGHGAPRRHRAAAARAGAHGVRGQRLARAAHAAHRHPGLPRDAARRRARGAASTRGASSRSPSATPSGSAAC